jgi:hypothetical protein
MRSLGRIDSERDKGEIMVVVPLANPGAKPESTPASGDTEANRWLRFAASGSLVAGGILLLSGKHRAGLMAAVAGTAMAMLNQQETVRTWWGALPHLIDDAGRVLNQVQGVVENLDTQRAKLRTLVGR